jgi:hypothetical protein
MTFSVLYPQCILVTKLQNQDHNCNKYNYLLITSSNVIAKWIQSLFLKLIFSIGHFLSGGFKGFFESVDEWVSLQCYKNFLNSSGKILNLVVFLPFYSCAAEQKTFVKLSRFVKLSTEVWNNKYISLQMSKHTTQDTFKSGEGLEGMTAVLSALKPSVPQLCPAQRTHLRSGLT